MPSFDFKLKGYVEGYVCNVDIVLNVLKNIYFNTVRPKNTVKYRDKNMLTMGCCHEKGEKFSCFNYF